MTTPIQLQRMSPRKRRLKPATVRALFWWVAAATAVVLAVLAYVKATA